MDLHQIIQSFLSDYYNMFEFPLEKNNIKGVWHDIISEATQDEKFRQKLIQSPIETLASKGFQLPEGLHIKFVEETADTIFLVIPPYVGLL